MGMDLLKNPFYVLKASPRDSRRRIMELAEERNFVIDADLCAEARSILTNPRRRLNAEMSWLPGVSPKKAEELLRKFHENPDVLLEEDSLPSLARVNLLATALEYIKTPTAKKLSEWFLALAEEYEYVEAEEIQSLINEDRIAAGFPKVSELSFIEEELKLCREKYRASMKEALDKLPSRELIRAITLTVEEDTFNGEGEVYTLVADLVDTYEVEAQSFLAKEEETIDSLIKTITTSLEKNDPDTSLKKMLDLLCQVVRNWDSVAQPIQVCAKSRGLGHEASQKLARKLRELSLLAFNNYGKLEISQQLTTLIHEVFLEVDTVAERAEEDLHTLEELRTARERSKKNEEAFQREITYKTNIGFFREPFRISPEGIEWKGRLWPLDSITRIRWGGESHLTGTTYSIFLGTQTGEDTITMRSRETFNAIVERLWKAVGISLLFKFIEGLRKGKEYQFRNVIIRDRGVEFFGIAHIYPWNTINFWSKNGQLYIELLNNLLTFDTVLITSANNLNRGGLAILPYLYVSNVHVLEAALRLAKKKHCQRLSEIFD